MVCCVMGVELCVMLVGVCCVGWGWFVYGVSSGGVGNNILACCNVFLTTLGICSYMARNSSNVSMAIVSILWNCVIVVIPYMYSLGFRV